MCRWRQMHCYCMMAFGIGLLLGQWLDSWFWCGGGGIAVFLLGAFLLRSR